MGLFSKFSLPKLSLALDTEIEQMWTRITQMYGEDGEDDAIIWSAYLVGVAIVWFKFKLSSQDVVKLSFAAVEKVAELSNKLPTDDVLQDQMMTSIRKAMDCASGEWSAHPEGCFIQTAKNGVANWFLPRPFILSHIVPQVEGLKTRLKRAT